MSFRSPFQGCSVKFSPFQERLVAVSTAQNFGIVGNGRLHILQVTPQGFHEIASFDTLDGLYDCAWSEGSESLIVTASGDGSVRAYDLSAPPEANPVRIYSEHTHEVHSVSWNFVRRDCFLTTSWDDTVRLWVPDSPRSVRTFAEHVYCVYAAAWCPSDSEVFITASGDCTCKIFDTRQPTSAMTMKPHELEVLAVDWNKYDDNVVATGSVDKSVRLWDLRRPEMPVTVVPAHGYAVRKVLFSPFHPGMLASCSYDMTVALWDTNRQHDPLIRRWGHHTEFAVGIDLSALVDGAIASTGWDGMTYVWDAGADPGMLPPRLRV